MTCRDCAFQSLILKLFILSSLSMDLASREDSQATSAGVWNSSGHCCKIDRSWRHLVHDLWRTDLLCGIRFHQRNVFAHKHNKTLKYLPKYVSLLPAQCIPKPSYSQIHRHCSWPWGKMSFLHTRNNRSTIRIFNLERDTHRLVASSHETYLRLFVLPLEGWLRLATGPLARIHWHENQKRRQHTQERLWNFFLTWMWCFQTITFFHKVTSWFIW